MELYAPANLERPLARIGVGRPAFREPRVNVALLVVHDQRFIDIVFHVLAYRGVGNERDGSADVFYDAKLECATDARLTGCRSLSRWGGGRLGFGNDKQQRRRNQ